MLVNVLLTMAASPPGVFWGVLKKLYDSGVPLWIIIIVAIIIVVAYLYNDEKNTSTPSPSSTSTNKRKKQTNPKNEETVLGEAVPVQPVHFPTTDSSSSIHLPSGTILQRDHYTILQHISSGGFGNTYFARDNDTASDVAIKELYVSDKCSRATNRKNVKVDIEANRELFAKFKKKFLKEARRLQMFHHPNIVKVYDCFEENGTAYYVMEFLPGKSLATIIKEQRLLTERQIRAFLPGILSALQAVHAQKIWHLDIKPANIVLRDNQTAVLIDFGASKQYEDQEGLSLSTSTIIAYTKGYAPPEQEAKNINNFGPWTDIYALGATLFAALTGHQPPGIDEIISDGLPSLPNYASPEMSGAIKAMMQLDKNRRPQSINEVAKLLQITIPKH